MSIIAPAKSHPDVVIAAVAARDHAKAKAYAKRHKIEVAHESYQGKRRNRLGCWIKTRTFG
jgi:predicted dehydrogenase